MPPKRTHQEIFSRRVRRSIEDPEKGHYPENDETVTQKSISRVDSRHADVSVPRAFTPQAGSPMLLTDMTNMPVRSRRAPAVPLIRGDPELKAFLECEHATDPGQRCTETRTNNREPYRKWTEARDYTELLELNRQALKELSTGNVVRANIFESLQDYGMLVLNSQRFIAGTHNCSMASSDSGSSTGSEGNERDSTLMTFIIPQKGRIEHKPLVKFLVSLALHNELQPSVLKFDRLCASNRGLLTSRHNSRLAMWQKQRRGQVSDRDTSTDQANGNLKQAFELHCNSFFKWFIAEGAMLEASKPLLIHVLSKDWDQEDLVSVIKGTAKRAGIEKVYAKHDEAVMYSPGMLMTR